MANYETHYLYAQGLKENLIAAGVIEELPHDSRACEIGNTHRIFFAKCSKEEWAKELAQILERGVIDCSKKNADGTYGVRRDYTPEEQEKLGWWPVQFSEDGNEMTWICKWVANDCAGYYASLALPNQTVIYTQFYEATYDGGGYLKGGKLLTKLPGIDVEGMEDTKDMLHAAIDALRANNLNGFADEMINRYYSVVEDKGHMTVRSQQLGIILDYVYFIEEKYNIDDAYTEEDKQVPDGPALEPDPDLPF